MDHEPSSADLVPGREAAFARAALEALSEVIFVETDPNDALDALCRAAIRGIPACRAASITVVENGRPLTPVATEPIALAADEAQYSVGDGPCLDAIKRRGSVSVPSIADVDWPVFAEATVPHGIQSAASFPLIAGDEVIGALNLYGDQPDAFADTEQFGALFARHVAATVQNARAYQRATDLAQGLAQALEHRDTIGQAKGILMASENLSSDEAFDVLRRASQRTNRKLFELAEEIVRRRSPGGIRD